VIPRGSCDRLPLIVVLGLLFNLSLGLGFSQCARDRIRVDGPFATPAFILLLLFVGLATAPATLYLYLAHPAWSWLYLVDPEHVPGLAVVPVLVAQGGIVVLGWYGGARLIRADKTPVGLYSAVGGLALLAILVLVLHARLGAYGSYAAYHEGHAAGLLQVKLGYVLMALALAMIVATGYTGLELLRDSRRVRAR